MAEPTAARAFGEAVDFGRTASDYRQHRAGFPPEFFSAIAERGYAKPGQRALDVGAGTGAVARGLARLGLAVTGVDPASALLEQAAEMDVADNLRVTYRQGTAEALTEESVSVDLVTAGQCWHWFDRPVAAAEAYRVLRPGGRILIAHFDWLPLRGNVVEATEAMILAVNPTWPLGGGAGIYPAWLRDLAEASFSNLETFSFDVDAIYSHVAWRGRIRASAPVKASLGAEAVERFDSDLAALLKSRFPDDLLIVPHRVWVATGVRPG